MRPGSSLPCAAYRSSGGCAVQFYLAVLSQMLVQFNTDFLIKPKHFSVIPTSKKWELKKLSCWPLGWLWENYICDMIGCLSCYIDKADESFLYLFFTSVVLALFCFPFILRLEPKMEYLCKHPVAVLGALRQAALHLGAQLLVCMQMLRTCKLATELLGYGLSQVLSSCSPLYTWNKMNAL